jgi:hypothetical protein
MEKGLYFRANFIRPDRILRKTRVNDKNCSADVKNCHVHFPEMDFSLRVL